MYKALSGIVVIFCIALFAACTFPGGVNGGYHYKVIVSVETPDGIVTGSAVRAVSFTDGLRLPESGPSIRPRGEMVAVDLGDRGVLFALTSFDDYRKVFAAFPGPPGLTPAGIAYYKSLVGKRASLPPEHYPTFVTFTDMDDPTSIVIISSSEQENKRPEASPHIQTLQRFFGSGVSLKGVSIEITDEPVTTGIVAQYAPSFHNDEQFMEWFKALDYRDPRRAIIDLYRSGYGE